MSDAYEHLPGSRLIRPVPRESLPTGVSAQILREINVVLVDESIFNPSDFQFTAQLMGMETDYLSE